MDPEPYRLSFELRDNHILARLEAGLVNLGIAVAFINDLVGEVRRRGVRKVLLVRKLPEPLPPNDDELIANIIANLLPPDAVFAVVDEPPEPAGPDPVEIVKAYRPNIVAFGSLDAAENWLLGESDQI